METAGISGTIAAELRSARAKGRPSPHELRGMLGEGRILLIGRIGGLVAQVVRRRSHGLAVVVVLVLLAVLLPAMRAQRSTSRDQKRLALAADKTLRDGLHGKLPPHISTLLGISSGERECPVMQGVERSANLVQGFDVSTTNKNDIVIFVVNEATNDQSLYLTSAAGRLRKVVLVKAGEGVVARITDQDKKEFEKEKQFWLDRLAPVRTSK